MLDPSSPDLGSAMTVSEQGIIGCHHLNNGEKMNLEVDISEWNGKSKETISRIYDQYVTHPEFLINLVEMLGQEKLQRGATWLLKHHFDEGGDPLDQRLVGKIYDGTAHLKHWEAKLHILQCVEHLPISKTQLPAVNSFIRACLRDDAKFVRAWAYSGFHAMAKQHPEFQQEVSEVLAAALSTETAGSILSRIRRVIKEGI